MKPDPEKFVIPGPNAAAALAKSHPHLCDRVEDPTKLPNVKVERYRLRKALLSPKSPRRDDEIRKAAARLSCEDQLAVCAEVDEIRKSGSGEDFRKGFWNRETHRYDLPSPGEQKREAPKVSRPLAVAGDGTSKVVRVAISDIVHWTTSDSTLLHGKVKSIGSKGVRAVDADGDEWQVLTADLHAGVAASAYIEHVQKKARVEKSQAQGK